MTTPVRTRRRRAATWRIGAFASLLLTACATSTALAPPEWTLHAVACADPAFGGGASFEQRLFMSPQYTPAGDPVARARFVRQLRERADADALALARELVAPGLAAAAADFVASPASAALWAAEGQALATYPWLDEGLVAQMVAACGQPEDVGPAALARVREVFAAGDGVSPSPSQMAIALGLARLEPDRAREIATFAASPSGAAWFAARSTALARTQERFATVRSEVRHLGFVTGVVELADVQLPRAVFADQDAATAEAPAITLLLDDAGCWRTDGEVLAPANDPGRLRAALRELRRRGIDDGRLSLRMQTDQGRSFEAIAEFVLVRVPRATAWAPVGELMKLCSEPEIAFWRIELDADPAIVPESFRPPRQPGPSPR